MVSKFILKPILIIILILIGCFYLIAGGIEIKEESVTINGYPLGAAFIPGKVLIMGFIYSDYTYASGGNRFCYYVFYLEKKCVLTSSVGEKGKNLVVDVKLVKQLLMEKEFYRGEINGICDDNLVTSIVNFQKSRFQGKADGRVDPKGKTIKLLVKGMQPKRKIFVMLARDYIEENSDLLQGLSGKVKIPQIKEGGVYSIYYNRVAFFSPYAIGRKMTDAIHLDRSDELYFREHLFGEYKYMNLLLGEIIIGEEFVDEKKVSVILRVNGKAPSIYDRDPDFFEKPLKISWHLLKFGDVNNIFFRYRLVPVYNEYSEWTQKRSTTYYFINAGGHSFHLEAKYTDMNGTEVKLPRAECNISLEKPLVAKTIYKTDIDIDAVSSLPQNIYKKSHALLFYTDDYSNTGFSLLPFVLGDVNALENILKYLGFDVNKHRNLNKMEIVNIIQKKLDELGEKDRLIVYFTGHGFEEDNEGYYACYKCNKEKLNSTCLPLRELNTIPSNHIKHMVYILDFCASGLGATIKGDIPNITRIATKTGVHMFTAGMADQKAQKIPKFDTSVFTHFIVEGLKGEADIVGVKDKTGKIIGDKIITLTELLIYVQNRVANETKSSQTPMLGRIKGAGEMIFDLRNRN